RVANSSRVVDGALKSHFCRTQVARISLRDSFFRKNLAEPQIVLAASPLSGIESEREHLARLGKRSSAQESAPRYFGETDGVVDCRPVPAEHQIVRDVFGVRFDLV